MRKVLGILAIMVVCIISTLAAVSTVQGYGYGCGDNRVVVNVVDNTDGTMTVYFSDDTLVVVTLGEVGPQGVPGETGPQGTIGDTGPQGVGIVSIVDNGDGTITINLSDDSSYIVTLPAGPQGVPGVDGVDGIDGTNGVDGIDGTNGIDGIDGTNGTDGINGTNGIDGINGTNGTDGVDGKDAVGIQGIEGVAGEDGSNGKMPWYYWLVWPAGAVGTGGAYIVGRKSVKQQTPA